jgi:hypothetical protein
MSNDHECTQKDVIQEIKDKVCHIDKTLYFGNGKPALTAKIDVIETKMDTMEKKIDGALNLGKTIVVVFIGLIAVDVYQMFKNHTAQEVSHASGK